MKKMFKLKLYESNEHWLKIIFIQNNSLGIELSNPIKFLSRKAPLEILFW